MIIDGHAHACGEFCKAETIIPILDRLGVNKVVLCPGPLNQEKGYGLPELKKISGKTDFMLGVNRIISLINRRSSTDFLPEGNAYVYSLQRKAPDRIIQFYWADPNTPNLETELDEKYQAWGFKGIKLHQCFQKFNSGSGIYPIARFAGEKGIPVLIHLLSSKDAMELTKTAQKYPETNFIIAHLIGLNLLLEHGRNLDNLYFEISPTPLISSERIYQAISAFGADKVILGSDTPYGKDNLQKNIKRVNELKITDHEKELILGENLHRLLRIS